LEAKKVIDASTKSADFSETEKNELVKNIALASLKFADLVNHRAEDYIFTPQKFTNFEGKTGPYILYTAVRIKSILSKIETKDSEVIITNDNERKLILKLNDFQNVIEKSWSGRAINILCVYIYELCVVFNIFYHNCQVLNEPDEKIKNSRN